MKAMRMVLHSPWVWYTVCHLWSKVAIVIKYKWGSSKVAKKLDFLVIKSEKDEYLKLESEIERLKWVKEGVEESSSDKKGKRVGYAYWLVQHWYAYCPVSKPCLELHLVKLLGPPHLLVIRFLNTSLNRCCQNFNPCIYYIVLHLFCVGLILFTESLDLATCDVSISCEHNFFWL